jgi:Flp pilus assembly protein TadG
MPSNHLNLLEGTQPIAIAWLIGAAVIVACLRAIARKSPHRSWRDLARAEDGASYSLGFMIVMPIFVLTVCLVVETTLILVTKIGTTYAAYAAARSAVVWVPSGVGSDAAQAKMKTAAVQAMTPFASGATHHQPIASIPSPADFAQYYAAHRSFADRPGAVDYIAAKYRYANWAVAVKTDAGMDFRKDVTLTLDYKAPFHLSSVGRFLGKRDVVSGFYYYPMTTVVKLENHAPKNETANPANRPLGISYVPQP